MLKILILFKYISPTRIQMILLNLKIFNFLGDRVNKLLELFRDHRIRFSSGLNLMSLMLTMNDTFCADWRAETSEAKVAHCFFRVLLTRRISATHSAAKGWCSTDLWANPLGSYIHVLVSLMEWWIPACVSCVLVLKRIPTSIRVLTLSIKISLTISRRIHLESTTQMLMARETLNLRW